MDTLIFMLIAVTLGAMLSGRPKAAIGLFVTCLLMVLALFKFHVTSSLQLNF
jgi:hypothetical protein